MRLGEVTQRELEALCLVFAQVDAVFTEPDAFGSPHKIRIGLGRIYRAYKEAQSLPPEVLTLGGEE